MTSDDHFLEKVQFSDEATFHVSGAVNRHNVGIWGLWNALYKQVRPKSSTENTGLEI
jgi:hypothetical protein